MDSNTWRILGGNERGTKKAKDIMTGGSVGSVVIFLKRAIVDGNQNGIGLGQIDCKCSGKFKLGKELGTIYEMSFSWDRLLAHVGKV